MTGYIGKALGKTYILFSVAVYFALDRHHILHVQDPVLAIKISEVRTRSEPVPVTIFSTKHEFATTSSMRL